MSSAFSNLTKKPTNEILYNFWRGHPNDLLLPLTEMQQILSTVCSSKNEQHLRESLQYLQSNRGDPVLIEEISSFFRRHTLEDELPNDVISPPLQLDMFLTHGVSHGLELLCATQTKNNDVVLIERPTYFLAPDIFISHGLRVQYLPIKRDPELRVDVEALAAGLKDGSIDVPRMIYIIPTNQNPLGYTMSIEDRWLLVKLARTYGFLVVADEVYHLLDWSQRRPARFSVLDYLYSQQSETQTKGCSISVNSFTKIFAPGIRFGFIEGPTFIIDSISDHGYIRSQGACTPFVGNIIRTALTNGLQDQILQNLIQSYKERSDMLCDILETEPGIRIHTRPCGGYFVWIEFLNITCIEVFYTYCLDRGLKFMPGTKCDPLEDYEQSMQPKDFCQNSARLCFADMDEKDVSDGAKMIVTLYREFNEKYPN